MKRGREKERKGGAMVGHGLLAHAVVAVCMFFTESLLVPAFTSFDLMKLRSPQTRPVRGTTPATSCAIAALDASRRQSNGIRRNNMMQRFDHSTSRLWAGTATSSPRSQRYGRALYTSSSTRIEVDDATEGATAEGGCDRLEFLKTAARRATVIGASGIVASAGLVVAGDGSGRPQAARAFCGEPYPNWAYFTDFDEVFVPFEYEGYKGELWVRTVGNEKDQKKVNHHPLVLIPGGPGLPHDYLETLEGAAADDRVVVAFDPIGTGNSSALPAEGASELIGTPALVAQTRTVLGFVKDTLKLSACHLFGHGTGAAAALELGRSSGLRIPDPSEATKKAAEAADGVLSVVLASPVLGGSSLPPDYLDSLRAPYTRGGNSAPICLETALQRKNAESFTEGLAGLKNSDGVKGKGALDCPVLITYGGKDVVEDAAMADLKTALSGGNTPVEEKKFPESGHMAHLDEREEYVSLIVNYVANVDKAWVGNNGGSKKKK